MAPKGLWLRLYAEITRDRKIRRMDIKLRWIWIAVMCMAKVSPEPGKLLIAEGIMATEEDIADEAAADLPDVQEAMQQFIAMNMVRLVDGCYELVHWEPRQYEYPSSHPDAAAERKRKSREKSGAASDSQPFGEHVTDESRACHEDVTSESQDRDRDRDREQNTEREITGECEGVTTSPAPLRNEKSVEKAIPPEALDLAEYLKEKIIAWKPNAKMPKANTPWADCFRLMMQQDRRDPDEIAAVIEFATNSAFWRANILSAAKVREHFDTLQGQMMAPRKKVPNGTGG